MRAAFYERLMSRRPDRKRDAKNLALHRVPLCVRRWLGRVVQLSEGVVMAREAGRWHGRLGVPLVGLIRTIFGRAIRTRLGSPDFIVLGGAKPSLRTMAFFEVMGIRCLQGWGMTETTGPLAVCNLHDRYRGAFGSCGDVFPGHALTIEDGQLVVEGPQVASGYVEPDGSLVPFHGRLATGDAACFDADGRLMVLGKFSDRITCDNGINYNPVPMEEDLKALDLRRNHVLDETVVVGDAKPRLGAIFFLREEAVLRASADYIDRLVREFNTGRAADERIGPWRVSEKSLRDLGALTPSGKMIRRRIEEAFAFIYDEH